MKSTYYHRTALNVYDIFFVAALFTILIPWNVEAENFTGKAGGEYNPTLPEGWTDRVVPYAKSNAAPASGAAPSSLLYPVLSNDITQVVTGTPSYFE
ncbi:MAG: hypothetical protein IH591_00650, partial [Bacteroidales bacterium]|nr:hypothetical protein [Bacteroidales bacterium]